VKSPPELWTELSNPEALARHLGDFGEIRITAVEPETKVEWEAEQASGVVQLKQSGWGTKVTLSVTRTPATPEQPPAQEQAIVVEPEPVAAAEPQTASVVEPEPPAEPEPAAAEPEPPAAEHAAVEPEPPAAEHAAVEPEPEPAAAKPEPACEPVAAKPESQPEPVAPIEPDPEPSLVEPEPQLGFFARLFRKRKEKKATIVEPEPQPSVTVEPESESAAEPEPKPAIEVVALAAPDPVYPDPPDQPQSAEPVDDLASELESLEDQMAAETAELLTGVLDRLGAAHHRPFSRG
jgi:hypothetical protein